MSTTSNRLATLAACGALLAALTLPRLQLQRPAPDAIVVVDITQSMNVTDAVVDGRSVSRLEFAKQALHDSVRRLPCGSKLGIGVFTQYRSLVLIMPVETCANARELHDMIDGIDGQMSWLGGSEIAKGVFLTMKMLKSLETPPGLVFITDGQEAPPINPLHRITLDEEAGAISGVLAGVGGDIPSPIPRVDPQGNPDGFWGPHDVMQEDLFAHGRQGTVEGEKMEETGPAIAVPPALRGTPGREHLSALREPYLQLLAAEAKLTYERLKDPAALAHSLQRSALERPQRTALDLRWIAGLLALALLTSPYATRLIRARRYRATSSSALPIESARARAPNG